MNVLEIKWKYLEESKKSKQNNFLFKIHNYFQLKNKPKKKKNTTNMSLFEKICILGSLGSVGLFSVWSIFAPSKGSLSSDEV